jgi:hypothetical protein
MNGAHAAGALRKLPTKWRAIHHPYTVLSEKKNAAHVDAYSHAQTECVENEKAASTNGSVILEVDDHVDIDVLVLVEGNEDGLKFPVSMNGAHAAGSLRQEISLR